MKEIKVSTLNASGEKLVGIETIPDIEQNQYPTVILAHGFGVTKEESGMFDDIAKALADKGILSFRFDFSGCGESEGDYSKTSLTKLGSDLSCILEFVKSQSNIDLSRLGILGQSFGTSTTISITPKIKCVIMMGSVAHPKETLSELFGDGYNPDGSSIRKRSSGGITKLESYFWKDLDNHKLLESIKQIHLHHTYCLDLYPDLQAQHNK